MKSRQILETIRHFIFLGLFILLFMGIARINTFITDWNKASVLHQQDFFTIEVENTKTLNKLDRRMQLSGCLLK